MSKVNSENHTVKIETSNSQENFILRSPKRGKIFRGPNWNAFNRQSLGSIPRKFENILFQEKGSEAKKGFLSQKERFEEYSQIESVKYSYPGPGKYQVKNESFETTASSKPSISVKGFGNGFTSKSERFDDPREYYEKFYPGPGQYNKAYSSIFDKNNKNNFRYNSLYSTSEVRSLKEPIESPGPGLYDPIIPLLLKKDVTNKMNYMFASKDQRFNNILETKNVNKLTGPGRYFNNTESIVKDPDKTSFFFKNSLSQNINPIENYVVDFEKKPRFNIPGPGEYNLRQDILDPHKLGHKIFKNQVVDEQENYLDKQREKELEELNLLKGSKQEKYHKNYQAVEDYKKSAKSVFESKSAKGVYHSPNHVPGPSYYNPQQWPSKISYNCNVDRNWI